MTAREARQRAERRFGGPPPSADVVPGLVVRRVDQIETLGVEWLWPGRIPRGMLTILDGNPDMGKSLVTIDVTARVTRGWPLPGCDSGSPAASVAFLATEDDAARTIRPRLEAAGADLKRCHVIDALRVGGTDKAIVLPDDLQEIKRFIVANGIALLIVDPILGYLNAAIDSHKDQSVRQALHELKGLAERTGVAILCIRHFTKGGTGSALTRGGGSIAIVAAARSGLVVGTHPDEPDTKVLAVSKSNLCRRQRSITYRIEVRDHQPVVEWREECDLLADDVVAVPIRRDVRDEADEFLRDALRNGPVAAADLRQRAEAEGISDATLRRTKSRLKVRACKQGFSGRWVWELPAPEGAHEGAHE